MKRNAWSANSDYQPLAVSMEDLPTPSPSYRSKASNPMLRNGSDNENKDGDGDTKRRSVQFPLTSVKAAEKESVYDHPGVAASIVDTDDGSDEYYDWSTDEDLVDQEAKFEEKLGVKRRQKGWGPKRIATFFLSTLIGSTLLAGVIAAIPILLHFYYYQPHPTERKKYITDNVSAWLYWTAANILLSWYLAMIVDIVPGIANLLIVGVWGEINETLRSRVELYNAAKDNIKPVLYGASCWVSWVIIFDGIFNLYEHADESKSRASYTPRTYQAIQILFFFTLLMSAEKILSHLIAFAFHKTAYSERIESLQHDLNVLDHLRNYRPKRQSHKPSPSAHRSVFAGFPSLMAVTPGHERTGFSWGLSGMDGRRSRPDTPEGTDDEGHAGDTEGVNSSTKKRNFRKSWGFNTTKQETLGTNDRPSPTDQPYPELHSYPPKPREALRSGQSSPNHKHLDDGDDAVVVQAARALKHAVLHDARNIKGKPVNTGLGWDVASAHEAKRLARSIYLAFKADHHRRYLIPSDFYPAYKKHEDAEEAFRIFDKDNNGDTSPAEVKTKVIKVYKERRALSRSLRDVNKALKTLDTIMILLAMVVLFFISLSVLNIGIGSSLTSFYTVGIAASFIFKTTASNAFDAVMFLFVTHPFDTGDRVFVDAENLVVKRMGLFATTFQRADGTETYYFNSQLFNKFITNARRSATTFENLTLQVAWRTPLTKLDELEKYMKEWLETEENRWFEPDTAIMLQKIDYQRCLEFTMGIGHNGNWQDWGLRNTRKTAFTAAVQFYCRQLGITYEESPLPVSLTDSRGQPILLPTTRDEGLLSPGPFSPNDEEEEEEEEDIPETIKPTLGFVPPPDKRTKLTRVRKSKYRRRQLQGMAAGAGD